MRRYTIYHQMNPVRMAAYEEYKEYKLIRDKALRALNYLLGKAYGQQVAEDFAAYDIAKAKLNDAQREWERVKNGPNANDISAAEAKVEAAEATVSLGWIEAPFNGTVTQAYPKIGDQVASGTPAFRIDDLSQLYVDLEIIGSGYQPCECWSAGRTDFRLRFLVKHTRVKLQK